MYERVKDSADSMMMSIVVEVEECTSLTVISCLSAIQNFNPFRLAAALTCFVLATFPCLRGRLS